MGGPTALVLFEPAQCSSPGFHILFNIDCWTLSADGSSLAFAITEDGAVHVGTLNLSDWPFFAGADSKTTPCRDEPPKKPWGTAILSSESTSYKLNFDYVGASSHFRLTLNSSFWDRAHLKIVSGSEVKTVICIPRTLGLVSLYLPKAVIRKVSGGAGPSDAGWSG